MQPGLETARRQRALVVVAVCLVGLGLLLIGSGASTPAAGRWGKPPQAYVLRQLGCALFGLIAGAGCVALGRQRLERAAFPLALALLGLSILTLVPGVGVRFGGARRQIGVGPLVFQPTILLVASLPLLVAARARRPLLALAVAALGGLVCLAQPNFGHLGTLFATLLGALAGLGARRALRAVSLVFLACGPLALSFPYVRWRVASFLQPALTRDTRALEAISAGAGALGVGYGGGVDKALLSAAPTDYMFATAVEELGWLGGAALLALLLGCARLAWSLAPAHDRALRAAAGGTAAFLLFPAAVHVAVCLRLFPVTGIHLPFLSYSGSSVVALICALSVLLGLARSPVPAVGRIPPAEASHE
jgi:cell division protein FtsW